MGELERLSRSRSGEVRLAERARIVLACLQGRRNDEVAREMGLRPNTVGPWRRRFAAHGLAGLRDEPGQANRPSTALNGVIEFWRNWNGHLRQEGRAGMAERWRLHWTFLMTRYGVCFANRVSSGRATVRGVLARTPSLPPRPLT